MTANVADLSGIVYGPVESEKTTICAETENTVAFWVNPKANKTQIKRAVKAFFPEVDVVQVRTSILGSENVKFGNTQGKTKKRKKAYVKLAAGQEINFAEMGQG